MTGRISKAEVKATGTTTPRSLADWTSKETLTYSSIAEAKADTKLSIDQSVRTLGYYSVGDGGGGEYIVVASATGTDDGGAYHNTDNNTQLKLLHNGTINMYQYGAVGDGVTDDWAAYRHLLRHASANNITMHIPEGNFFIGTGQGGMALLGSLKMTGEGEKSAITREEVQGTTAPGILNYTSTTRLPYVEITDVTFMGQYDVLQEERSTTYAYIKNVDHVNITGCAFKNISFLVTAFESCKNVHMSNNLLENCARDGLRAIGCNKVTITGNSFKRLHDDAIAIHTNPASTISSIEKTQIVVANNNLEECQGIAILGGQNVSVTGNVLTRTNIRGISVVAGDLEGKNTPYAITITGNTITDMMARVWSTDGWVTLNWEPILTGSYTRAIEVTGTGSNLTADKTYQLGTNGFPQQPYGLVTNTDTTLENVIAATGAVNISSNTISRTIPYGVPFSSLGYGTLWAKNGTPPDLVTGSDAWKVAGIYILGDFADLNITSNVLSGLYEGIHFGVKGGSTANSIHNSCKITGNTFIDIHKMAIANYNPQSSYHTDFRSIQITGNYFDLDPFYLGNVDYDQTAPVSSKFRRTNGSWAVSYVTGEKFEVRSGFISRNKLTGSVKLSDNVFKNTCIICADNVAGGALELPNCVEFKSNTLWIGVGSSVATFGDLNLGIGQLDLLTTGSHHVYYDCDTLSVSYGTVEDDAVAYTGTPTGSYYMRGKEVLRANPYSGSWVKLVRATTGSGNVLGVDWLQVDAT